MVICGGGEQFPPLGHGNTVAAQSVGPGAPQERRASERKLHDSVEMNVDTSRRYKAARSWTPRPGYGLPHAGLVFTVLLVYPAGVSTALLGAVGSH
ncbi:hypothetical protein PhaeoP97_00857 [Phaeobacter porticola]|uniref:Uncharacterized protein n=2 Tax=Phaeobacter porticola TaxID=1844006 RepID=A0A1L3I2F4_9RHOB|nr:hypothetical protein PhaeoP97_00857 [Phaeobacter porticola]